MQTEKISVVIADDHPLIRLGIRNLFGAVADMQIVGEALNGQEAVQLVEKLHPDVLILDLQMPVMDGIDVLFYFQKHAAKVRILVLSAFDENCTITEVLTLGAWGYYLKDYAPAVIVDAVRQAVLGQGKGTRPHPIVKGREKQADNVVIRPVSER